MAVYVQCLPEKTARCEVVAIGVGIGALWVSVCRVGQDYVSVYECGDFTQIRRFPIDTVDALSIQFSPDNV
jgi:hypothetical protein